MLQKRGPPNDPPNWSQRGPRAMAHWHIGQSGTAELIGYGVDIAIITETHLKKKHANSYVQVDGYTLFRHDSKS